ncbi:MAG: hypothetical protein ACFFDS_03770 [Candidatus Thorarchaeota archaeon]
MSAYELKNFQKGFEEDQAKVGVKVASKWIFAHQTPTERLKEVYSQPDFDPETRHYCFKGKEMVGFLTTRVLEEEEGKPKKASLVFPSVLPGHEEATDLLYEKAIETLKNKGVEVVETYASALCGNQVDLANKYGFKYVKDVDNLLFTLKVSNIDEKEDTSKIRKFDKEKDLEAWIELVKKYDEADDERIKRIVEELGEEENSIAHLVIEEDGKIVGTTLVWRNPINTSSANLAHTYFTDVKYLRQLTAKAAKIAKKENIDYYLIWLFGKRLSLRKEFEQLNVNYAQPSTSLFEKKI